MLRRLTKEPTLVLDLVKALIAIAVAFGLPLSGGQTAAVAGLVLPIMALSVINRQAVTPNAAVVEKAEEVATKVATDLGSTAAGAVGTITDRGVEVAKQAVDTVLGKETA